MNGPLTEAPQLIGEASGGGCDHNNNNDWWWVGCFSNFLPSSLIIRFTSTPTLLPLFLVLINSSSSSSVCTIIIQHSSPGATTTIIIIMMMGWLLCQIPSLFFSHYTTVTSITYIDLKLKLTSSSLSSYIIYYYYYYYCTYHQHRPFPIIIWSFETLRSHDEWAINWKAPQLIGEASGGGCDHNNDGLAVFQISYLLLSSLRIQVLTPLPSSSSYY